MGVRKALADAVRRTLRALGFKSVARTVRGAPLRIPLAMGELRSLLFDPTYAPFFNEDDVMDVLAARMRAEDVVFDIGAYHGVWAVLLARHAREVVAFEPNPDTFAVLLETIAVNRARNISASPIAIGGESGTTDFWGTGSGASLRPGQHRSPRNRVRVETLDSFVDQGAPHPDVIKIDVEGAEHQVLAGAGRSLPRARLVCIEVHFGELPKFGADYAMLSALMADAGFVEIMRSQPARLGAEDATRMHVIWERKSEGVQIG
ncbi:MAG TPA: FkbM family methyltransferase [Vicinamibacterales bacterium]|nr:FkbM family methyltransferase [Vicinamibacterales bacterium]